MAVNYKGTRAGKTNTQLVLEVQENQDRVLDPLSNTEVFIVTSFFLKLSLSFPKGADPVSRRLMLFLTYAMLLCPCLCLSLFPLH